MVWVCRTLTPDALCAVETGGLDRGCYLAGIGRAMSDEAPQTKLSCIPGSACSILVRPKGKQHAALTTH